MDKEQILKMDPYMLLSWVNMKLRDENINLEELCRVYDIDADNILERLKSIGYEYNSSTNQFK